MRANLAAVTTASIAAAIGVGMVLGAFVGSLVVVFYWWITLTRPDYQWWAFLASCAGGVVALVGHLTFHG